MYLVVTYWGSDKENLISGENYIRDFDISVDKQLIAKGTLNENKPYVLFDVFYTIPQDLTKGKSNIEVKFSSTKGKIAGRGFGVRITLQGEV